MGQNFSSTKDGLLLGLWSSSANFGSVVGYFMPTVIVYYMEADWKWALVVAGVLTILMSVLMKILIPEPELPPDNSEKTLKKCSSDIVDYFKVLDHSLYCIILVLIGGTQYGILLWLPMYLQ